MMTSSYVRINLFKDFEITENDKNLIRENLKDVYANKEKNKRKFSPRFENQRELVLYIEGGSFQPFSLEIFNEKDSNVKDFKWHLYFPDKNHLGLLSFVSFFTDYAVEFETTKLSENEANTNFSKFDDREETKLHTLKVISKQVQYRCKKIREGDEETNMFGMNVTIPQCMGHKTSNNKKVNICYNEWKKLASQKGTAAAHGSMLNINSMCMMLVKILGVHMQTPESWNLKTGNQPLEYTASDLDDPTMLGMIERPWYEELYNNVTEKFCYLENCRSLISLNAIYLYDKKLAFYGKMCDAVVKKVAKTDEAIDVGTIGILPENIFQRNDYEKEVKNDGENSIYNSEETEKIKSNDFENGTNTESEDDDDYAKRKIKRFKSLL